MKTKHFLAMRKDIVAHKCVDSIVWGLSLRGVSRPRLNRPTEDGEVLVMVMQLCTLTLP